MKNICSALPESMSFKELESKGFTLPWAAEKCFSSTALSGDKEESIMVWCQQWSRRMYKDNGSQDTVIEKRRLPLCSDNNISQPYVCLGHKTKDLVHMTNSAGGRSFSAKKHITVFPLLPGPRVYQWEVVNGHLKVLRIHREVEFSLWQGWGRDKKCLLEPVPP